MTFVAASARSCFPGGSGAPPPAPFDFPASASPTAYGETCMRSRTRVLYTMTQTPSPRTTLIAMKTPTELPDAASA